MVVSYEKDVKCECGKKAVFCRGEDDCGLALCKGCFDNYDENTISFVDPVSNNDENIENILSDEESNHERSDDCVNLNDINECDERNLNADDLANYVTRSDDHEFLADDTVLLRSRKDGEEENDIIPDFIPTSSAGEIAVEVEEKVKYGFKFSGCNILNNAGSLLTRRCYDIKKANMSIIMFKIYVQL